MVEYIYKPLVQIRGRTYFPNGKVEFEGEFLFDRKWNGKKYDEKVNLIYELINGNGKVKEYNYEVWLLFDGEYIENRRNGKGKEYDYANALIFEGEYLDDERNGLEKNIIKKMN